jgi:hypothetical protein
MGYNIYMSIEQKVRPVVLEPGQTVTAFGPQDYAEEDPGDEQYGCINCGR